MQPEEPSAACAAESAPIEELIGEALPEDHDPWKGADDGDTSAQPVSPQDGS